MYKVWLVTAAIGDIRHARDWYETRQAGLGDAFMDSVEKVIDSIAAFPASSPIVHRGARRFLVERFPYCLYYRVEADAIVVVACLHALRDPGVGRRRMRG